jgi:hypothetical protein
MPRSSRFGLLLLAAAFSCGPPTPVSIDPAVEERALHYLATTRHEFGLDVAAITRVYAGRTNSAQATDIANQRLQAFSTDDLQQLSPLHLVEWTPMAPASVSWLRRLRTPTPPPEQIQDDDRVRTCIDSLRTCNASPDCVAFAKQPAWGYILTHQALWLLMNEWLDCSAGVNTNDLRHQYAARLIAETAADPVASDLFFERLAMLAHLGFANEIRAEWIQTLVSSQHPDGCFPASIDTPCHPHPTALALWTLSFIGPHAPPRESP